MSDPAYIRALKTFTKRDLTIADLPALEEELYGGNDRATAVMLGSVAEMALTTLLRKRVIQTLNSDQRSRLFDYEGPLGTFSSKILLGYAVGVIGPISRADLDLIRLLRNEFAHFRGNLKFKDSEVEEVCKHLQTPSTPGAFIPLAYLQRVPDEQLAEARDVNHPKTRYISACHSLSERMLNAAYHMPSLIADSGVP